MNYVASITIEKMPKGAQEGEAQTESVKRPKTE